MYWSVSEFLDCKKPPQLAILVLLVNLSYGYLLSYNLKKKSDHYGRQCWIVSSILSIVAMLVSKEAARSRTHGNEPNKGHHDQFCFLSYHHGSCYFVDLIFCFCKSACTYSSVLGRPIHVYICRVCCFI